MTAAIDHATLRLIRVSMGELTMGSLAPGVWKELSTEERKIIFR